MLGQTTPFHPSCLFCGWPTGRGSGCSYQESSFATRLQVETDVFGSVRICSFSHLDCLGADDDALPPRCAGSDGSGDYGDVAIGLRTESLSISAQKLRFFTFGYRLARLKCPMVSFCDSPSLPYIPTLCTFRLCSSTCVFKFYSSSLHTHTHIFRSFYYFV